MEMQRVVYEVAIKVFNTIKMKSYARKPICGICSGQSGKETGLSPSTSVFPDSKIRPPAHISLIRRTSGHTLGTLKKNNTLPNTRQQWTQDYFHNVQASHV